MQIRVSTTIAHCRDELVLIEQASECAILWLMRKLENDIRMGVTMISKESGEAKVSDKEMKVAILGVVTEFTSKTPAFLSVDVVLKEVDKRLNLKSEDDQKALLDVFYDLFREGHLSWGWSLSQPHPPYFHLTKSGMELAKVIATWIEPKH